MKKTESTNTKIIKKMFKGVLLGQIISGLIAVLGIVVDGIIIGRCLGETRMSAYGLISPLSTIFMALGGFCSAGISAPLSKLIGRGEKDKAISYLSTCFVFALMLGLVVATVVTIFAPEIAVILGADDTLKPLVVSYLRGLGISVPAMMVVMMLIPVMQIDGDRMKMYLSVTVMTLINIALDILNAYVIKMDMHGMALATSISYYVCLILMATHFAKKNKMLSISFKALNFKKIGTMFSYGMPNAFQHICHSLLVFCINKIIISISDSGYVAVYAAILSAANMCLALGTGIGSSTQIVTSIFNGEKDEDNIKLTLKYGLNIALIYDAILMSVLIAFSQFIMPMFFKEKGVLLDEAIFAFRLYALCMIPYSFNVTFRNFFHAMHNVKATYTYVFFANFASTALAALILGKTVGLTGVWLAYFVGESLTFLVYTLICVIKNREAKSFYKLFNIPKDVSEGLISAFTFSLESSKDIQKVSENIFDYCLENGAGNSAAYAFSYGIEALMNYNYAYGGNIENVYYASVRVANNNDKWILSIRDNGHRFNAFEFYSKKNKDDYLSHMSVRLLQKMATQVDYRYSLKINNIVITINK